MQRRVVSWHPWLHILGLWTIVFAHPLLSLLAASPEFFVAHGAGRSDILLLTAGLTLGVPTIIAAAVALAGLLGERVRAGALLAVIGLLVGAFAMQAVKSAGVQQWTVAVPMAAAAGLGGALAYWRAPAVRTFASALSVCAVVVPVLFLSRPSVRDTMRATEAAPVRALQPVRTARPVPVVMVVVDETPLVSLLDADRKIDPVLYPNLAALAHDGVWFRNATAVSDYTRWAVPAMLTGLYPRPRAQPTAADYPNTLFTVAGVSHRLEVVEAVTRICPEALCGRARSPLPQRLASVGADLEAVSLHVLATDDLRATLPSLSSGWADFTRPGERRRAGKPLSKLAIARAFIDWISRDDPQPTFYFLHTLLTHFPHERLPTGQRNATRAAVPGEASNEWTDDEWGVAQQYQRHLLQIGLVDRVIGRLVAKLKDEGLYDRALVIVTADHGISFQPGHPRRDFTEATAADIMHVPLIVKPPRGTPLPEAIDLAGQRVSDRNVESVDMAPTVAAVLGIALPWQTDGVSVLDDRAPARAEKRMFFASARQQRTYGPEGPDLSAALARKFALFGANANPFRVPHPPRYAALVGREVDDLRVVDGRARVLIDDLDLFDPIDPTAGSVPFDIAGRVERPGGDEGPTFLGVAVNGTLRAVTRTWRSQPDRWLATPPLDAWHKGHNDLDVFIVDEDARGPVLRKVRVEAAPAS